MPEIVHDVDEAHSDPYVKHHFVNAAQQMDADTLGMWTFLITEVLFFGGMFAAYAVYRNCIRKPSPPPANS